MWIYGYNRNINRISCYKRWRDMINENDGKLAVQRHRYEEQMVEEKMASNNTGSGQSRMLRDG